MYEAGDDSAEITYQWVVGDLRPLEKKLAEIAQPKHHYVIMIISRLAAYAVTFAVAYHLLADAKFSHVLWIAAAGTLSIWIALALELFASRALERLLASDPRRIGWNSIWLDRSGVTFATETTEDYASWLGVTEVDQFDGSIWIKTGPVQGFYIPARIFVSAEERQHCLNLIERLRREPLPPRHLVSINEELTKH